MMAETVSWWVGKDREAFNVELKEHADRMMRSGGRKSIGRPRATTAAATVQAVVVLDAPPKDELPREVVLAPPPYRKNKAWREKNVAAGLCARCGRPRKTYAYHCDSCQATKDAENRRREGFQPWRPGSRGAIPKAVKPRLEAASEVRCGILEEDEAKASPVLGRAAVVMLCGFLLQQNVEWIAAWTKYGDREVRAVIRRLRAAGIWSDGLLSCLWMDVFVKKHTTKRNRYEADVAFWLDAMVAAGDLTRETRDGEFYYGLRKERGNADDR